MGTITQLLKIQGHWDIRGQEKTADWRNKYIIYFNCTSFRTGYKMLTQN